MVEKGEHIKQGDLSVTSTVKAERIEVRASIVAKKHL
jgi:hypothetical protein